MNQGTIALIVSVFSAMFAGIACVVPWYIWRRQTDVQHQANNEEKLNNFLIEAYVLRPYAWSVQAKEHDFVTERSEVRRAFIASPHNWEEELSNELVARVVPEMAHSLQQIGLSAFLGAVPLTLVFAVVGDALILDWLIVQPYVAQLNAAEPIRSLKNTRTPVLAKRRHAEWVTALAYLWLRTNWDCQNLYGGVLQRMKMSDSELVKRVEDITHADAELFTVATADSIERLVGVSLHHCREF
ncbi:hypothetical protein EJV47_06410 [Hymenobacter gummosus]|uniref:Uncharacterized protein n=1 Tax=Hymenobacter gummosus TaxID=1776032 RepID=A0A3S0H6L8_9BACT|nr:hypothetical protein [Hymenobacter gummosus]RTQ51433.1 hypothetical protein EJV47_06410 [Hymenobacter gummosus]